MTLHCLAKNAKILLQLNQNAVKMGEKPSTPPSLQKVGDLMLY